MNANAPPTNRPPWWPGVLDAVLDACHVIKSRRILGRLLLLDPTPTNVKPDERHDGRAWPSTENPRNR